MLPKDEWAMNSLQKVFDFLNQLDQEHIHYTLTRARDYALMVTIVVPGERWEVEFYADGQVEVEIFRSDPNGMLGEEALPDLFRRFSD